MGIAVCSCWERSLQWWQAAGLVVNSLKLCSFCIGRSAVHTLLPPALLQVAQAANQADAFTNGEAVAEAAPSVHARMGYVLACLPALPFAHRLTPYS